MGVLARYMAKPSIEQWTAAVKSVLQYIAGTLSYGITFKWTDTAVGGYSDADHVGDSDNRTSTTHVVFMSNGGAFSWKSRLQPTVAV